MHGDQYDQLTPDQVRATIASLPRRLRETLRSDPTVDVAGLAGTAVPNGRSVVAVLTHLASVAEAGRQAVHDIVIRDRPHVAAPAAPPSAGTAALSDVVERTTEALERAASELAGVEPNDWLREGVDASGDDVTALTVARDLARRAVGLLKELEVTVAALAKF